MDFHRILMVASEQQGLSAVPKRYSLAVGPPKKDPKVKGVHSAAVQAFLKRQEEEQKQKALEEKRRKEELLAKRVELKHDRKARAMASRTKDNFRGYNGIPVEEKSKKRQGRESSSDRNTEGGEYVTGDEMEQFEHNQTDSEPELEEYEEKPSKPSVKPKTSLRGAPPVMNFQDLLKLAEKKQHEPVEIKVVKKTEERPMTAEELREREYLERKNRKGIILKEKKTEKEVKNVIASSSSKKDIPQKEFVKAKLAKPSTEKNSLSKGRFSSQGDSDKKIKGSAINERHASLTASSKPNHSEKMKPMHKGPLKSPSNSSHIKPTANGGGKSGVSSHAPALKTNANNIPRQPSVKELGLKKASGHTKPTSMASVQPEGVKTPSSKQINNTSSARSSLIAGHGSQGMGPGRSGNSSGLIQRNSGSSMGPGRPSNLSTVGSGRPGSSSGPVRPTNNQSIGPGRPGGSLSGLGRGNSSGSGLGHSSSTLIQTAKPKCTVVSETISSKNLGPKQGSAPMNGMRPFSQQRPGYPSQGFPRPSLPPITYKRQYEDEDEEDSEMEDFIDDEGEPQEEISKHIREIFGYDRNRYKDESDYALRYMESSWKEQQKEEAKRTLRKWTLFWAFLITWDMLLFQFETWNKRRSRRAET
nr:protein SPT2 homolog isoform X1 [Pogona vitticeps]